MLKITMKRQKNTIEMHYHQFKSQDWRQEQPDLDKNIEELIEKAIEGNISFVEFTRDSGWMKNEIKQHYGRKHLSQEAAENYIKILNSVYENLKENE